MQHSTSTKQRDILKSQSSIKENPNYEYGSEQIIEREPIEGTPFTLITTQGKSFGVLGKYALTEKYDTKEEVLDYMDKNFWNLVITVSTLTAEQAWEIKANQAIEEYRKIVEKQPSL